MSEQLPNADRVAAAKQFQQDIQNGLPTPVCLSIKELQIADWEFRTLAILLDVIENPPGFPCSRELTREEKARMTAYLATRYALTPSEKQP